MPPNDRRAGLAGFGTAADGGPAWRLRTGSHGEVIARLWTACRIADEWSWLEAVLRQRPGAETLASREAGAARMLAPLDPVRARAEHGGHAEACRPQGVEVLRLEPKDEPCQAFPLYSGAGPRRRSGQGEFYRG